MRVLLSIWPGLHGRTTTILVVAAVVLTPAIVPRRRLRRIRNNLQTARH
jgi:hypothetical protein